MKSGHLTALLTGTLVLCLAGGAVGAYAIGRQQAAAATANQSSPELSPTPQSSAPDTPSAPAPNSADPSVPNSADPSALGSLTSGSATSSPEAASSSALPSSSTSGQSEVRDRTVALSDTAQQHAAAADVRDLLQRHFDAINSRDYDAWSQTVTPDQVTGYPRDKWMSDYSTTDDFNVVIMDLSDTEARVSFTSFQEVSRSATDSTCTSWELTMPLEDNGSGGFHIGRPPRELVRSLAC